MARQESHITTLILIILSLGVFASDARASDPPDSAINPQSGFIETIDSAWDQSRYNVRHVTNPGPGGEQSVVAISTSAHDDLSPRLAISEQGETWVVWWRNSEVPKVLVRKRTPGGGAWTNELPLSEKTEPSRRPEIVHDGSRAWVVYEFDDSGGEVGIGVNSIIDEPNPIPVRHKLAETDFAGDLDVLIHFDTDSLWVTWVDSAVDVGWSAYDSTTEIWQAPDYESYATDSVEEARARIRVALLGE